MTNAHVVDLKEIAKKVQLRLAVANPQRETHVVNLGATAKETGFLLAYVAKDEPKIIHTHCPWQTRYVFMYLTDADPQQVHAYFFNEPYNSLDEGKIYEQAYYDDGEESVNVLYEHAFEHLIMKVQPMNAPRGQVH